MGILAAKVDWGSAPEYVEAMWLMLQEPEPEDYVIGTGESHSVREFVEAAFREAGIKDWEPYVGIDPRYYRPAEVENLIADPTKAERKLKWKAKTKFADLVRLMVRAEIDALGAKK